MNELKPKHIFIFMPLLLLAIIIFNGVYTINSGTVGVLSTFGKYSTEVQEPGLHFKLPFIQQISVIDTKMQTANYQGEREKNLSEGLITKPKIIVLDSKNLAIGIEITVQYAPIPKEAQTILVKYGKNYFEKLINPIVRDVVRNVTGQYQAEEIAVKRTSLGNEIEISLREKLSGGPFRLNAIQIRNIELPQIVRKKVEEVQLAKQEEQRLAMIEKQAMKNQRIKAIDAETEKIIRVTQANANSEKQRIDADAEAYKIIKEATALAKANREIAASITPQLIEYQAIKQWNGRYPTTLLGGNQAGLLLQLPTLDSKGAHAR
ncbi:MAG: Modulator of FtsH protease HflC [Chlamydiae bacterium]|nr:Modulator of FtsH protease HflC [Chlamydiota bacterium]